MALIEDQIKAAFLAALAGAATTVDDDPDREVEPADLPGLFVLVGDEDVELDDKDGELQHTVEVSVVIAVRAGEASQAQVGALRVDVEERIYGSAAIAALVQSIDLAGVQADNVAPDAERTGAYAAMRWSVVYTTQRGAPEAAT